MATGANKTTYWSDKILNLLRATNITAPVAVYAGLYTTQTTDAGGGTEVTGTAYVREAITFGAPSAAAPSGEIVQNTAAVQFPTAGSNWGTIIAFSIMDAATTGNMLYWGTLAFSVTINTGQTRAFDVSDLTVLED